jgi:hypothetical protein
LTKHIQDPAALIQFDSFYDRLFNKFKKPQILEPILTQLETAQSVSCPSKPDLLSPQLNQEICAISEEKTTDQADRKSKQLNSKKPFSNWPNEFKFPVDKLTTQLESALKDPSTVLTKQQKNTIASKIAEKIQSYNM